MRDAATAGVLVNIEGHIEGATMSFQAYLDNIHAKTGKTPEQLKALATTAGVYRTDMKAGDLVAWLKKEFDLGHGHSMAVWKYFTDSGWVNAPRKSK